MINPDQIPDAVADSMREFFFCRGDAQKAIAAALNAWPALKICYFLPQGRTIMLPFPNVSKYPRKEGDA